MKTCRRSSGVYILFFECIGIFEQLLGPVFRAFFSFFSFLNNLLGPVFRAF
jgi:hypothetical protein